MPINSKKKGTEGEREWAHFCNQYGFECRRTAQYCGKSGEAADVVGIEGIHQEVKRVEHLNIYDAMAQAQRDCGEKMPIVAHRKNRKPWLVTMRAEDFLELLTKAQKYDTIIIQGASL